MRGYVANTDFDWYTFLASRPHLDEVNFWQPSGGRGFHAIRRGEIFFFKLKKPHYAVAGFGVFERHTVLPAWLAWEAFGDSNGVPTLEVMRTRIERYRRATSGGSLSYQVGCLIVVQPMFFPPGAWVPQPADWGPQTVQGKAYDLTTGKGLRLWEACRTRATALASSRGEPSIPVAADGARYGAPQLIRPRLGQGAFRIAVTDAYRRSCAVTTEHSLPVLEAAHIRPYAEGGAHEVANGILLRRDIHRLFDMGYVTVASDDYRFEVSRRLKEEWENGRAYYDLRGTHIQLPLHEADKPDRTLLAWHNEHLFQS